MLKKKFDDIFAATKYTKARLFNQGSVDSVDFRLILVDSKRRFVFFTMGWGGTSGVGWGCPCLAAPAWPGALPTHPPHSSPPSPSFYLGRHWRR